MHELTISLSDEQLAQLQQLAERAGISPEEYVRRHVQQLLDQPSETFEEAADYVLKKNAELYRRLA